MNPDSALAGIRLKRKRAWEQIGTLKAEIKAFLDCADPRPYTARIDFNRDTKILTASVHIDRFPDPMWGIRIGEIVHNLRSALDHLVYTLYFSTNRKPLPTNSKLQFPIAETKAGFDNWGRPQYLKDVRTDAVDLILAEQRFPVAEGGRGDGADSPLWHLKELSNCDKHRTIHLTGTLVEKSKFTFAPLKQKVRVRRQDFQYQGPIEQDAILARAQFIGADDWPFVNRQVNCEFTVYIAFDQRTPAVGGWLVAETLDDIANRTDLILSHVGRKIFNGDL